MTAASRPTLAGLVASRSVVELKEFSRSRDQMFFIFAFPVFLLLIFGAAFGNADLGGGVKFTHYLLAGLVASGILNTGFQSLAISLAIDRDNDVLKRLSGTPLPPIAYFLGKVVLVLVVSLVQVALLMVVGVVAFGAHIPTDAGSWLTFAWVFVLGTAAATALGIAASSLPRTGRSASAVLTPIVLGLQFISGVFLVYSDLPRYLQTIAEIFPLKWLAQGMRSFFLPDSFALAEPRHFWELESGAFVLTVWVLVGLYLALKTFRWLHRRDR